MIASMFSIQRYMGGPRLCKKIKKRKMYKDTYGNNKTFLLKI